MANTRDAVTCYGWTTCGPVLIYDATPQSRTFVARASNPLGDRVVYADQVRNPANALRLDNLPAHANLPPGPYLSASELAEVDRRFARAIQSLDAPDGRLGLSLFLTDGDVFESARKAYVIFEPMCDVVVALSPTTGESSLTWTDTMATQDASQTFNELGARVRALTGEHRLVDALGEILDWALIQLQREKVAPIGSPGTTPPTTEHRP